MCTLKELSEEENSGPGSCAEFSCEDDNREKKNTVEAETYAGIHEVRGQHRANKGQSGGWRLRQRAGSIDCFLT